MTRQQAIEVQRNGLTMRGMTYLPPRPARAPAVLMLHGFTGQRMEHGFMFVKLARALAERGLAAVTFDYLHSGESDGSFDQMLVSGELADTLAMTQWLQSRGFADRSRLAVLGFSLGGLLAACAGAKTGAFKAMVLLAPTTAQNLSRLCQRTMLDGQVVLGPHTLHKDFFADLGPFDPVGEVVKHPRPTLLLQGSADTAVDPSVSQQFVDAMETAGILVDYHLLPQADHAFSGFDVRRQMIATVSDWLDQQLIR